MIDVEFFRLATLADITTVVNLDKDTKPSSKGFKQQVEARKRRHRTHYLLEYRDKTTGCLETTPLHNALNKNFANDTESKLIVQQVKELLKHDYDINALDSNGFTALHYALSLNHDKRIVKILLESGANPNVRSENVGFWRHLNPDSYVNLVTGCYARFGETLQGVSALHIALRNGKLCLIKTLLDYGADLEQGDYYGKRPLHYAVECEDERCLKLLLKHGANLKQADNYGYRPLDFAVRSQFSKTKSMKILLKYGANAEQVSTKGRRPIHYASSISSSYRNIHSAGKLKCLIDHGVDLDAQDNLGYTALHYSVEKGNLRNVKQLIAAGSDIYLAAKNEKTPYHIAIARHKYAYSKSKLFGNNPGNICHIITHNLICSITAGLKGSENFQIFKCCDYIERSYMQDIGQECLMMKSRMLSREVTLHDILVTDDPSYLTKVDILQALDSIYLPEEYPRYYWMLKNKIDLDRKRFELINRAGECLDLVLRWRDVTNNTPRDSIPYHLVKTIVSHLTRGDLKNSRNLISLGETLERQLRKRKPLC